MASARGSFEISSWDETPYREDDDGRKLTEAVVTQTFTGDIAGEGSVRWLMCYRPDGTADWIGHQRIEGTVGERSGSVVILSMGTFDGAKVEGTLSVVRGSGTGDLVGLEGEGRMEAPMGSQASYELEYGFG
jgi:hypothetical protein